MPVLTDVTLISNHPPWTIIAVTNFVSALTLLSLRYMLVTDNKRRNAEKRDDTYDDVYITQALPDGTTVEKKVDRVCPKYMDLSKSLLNWFCLGFP